MERGTVLPAAGLRELGVDAGASPFKRVNSDLHFFALEEQVSFGPKLGFLEPHSWNIEVEIHRQG